MQTFFVIELAFLGLVIGSFLNVVIARLPEGESIVTPRSHCPKCGYVLRWYENIPVASWVALRGRCSSCKEPISVRYVLIELLTGSLFLAALVRFGWTWELVMGLTFITLLIPLVFIDAEHWVLPFELTLPGIALGVLLQLPRGWPSVQDSITGAVIAFLLFRFMEAAGWFFARKEALGAGDKYLLAVIGAFMGWKVLLGVVLLSSLQGALFGIARIAFTGRAAAEPPAAEPPAAEPPAAEPPAAEPPAAEPPAAASESAPDEEPPLVFTPDFLRPGLSFPRRLLLLPWTLFLQPIPDDPVVEEGDEDAEPEWVPGPTNMPFGPWIGLAGLQVMLLGPWISSHLGSGLVGSMLRLVFIPTR